MLVRKQTYTIEEMEKFLKPIVLENIETKKKKLTVVLNGDEIYALSDRYKLFFTKGYKCVCCGLEGKFFAKEKDENVERYHLNLYGYNQRGEEVLMTKDHIIPISKGGKDIYSNYQPMCEPCNKNKKSNVDDTEVDELLQELERCTKRAEEIRKYLNLKEKKVKKKKKKISKGV